MASFDRFNHYNNECRDSLQRMKLEEDWDLLLDKIETEKETVGDSKLFLSLKNVERSDIKTGFSILHGKYLTGHKNEIRSILAELIQKLTSELIYEILTDITVWDEFYMYIYLELLVDLKIRKKLMETADERLMVYTQIVMGFHNKETALGSVELLRGIHKILLKDLDVTALYELFKYAIAITDEESNFIYNVITYLIPEIKHLYKLEGLNDFNNWYLENVSLEDGFKYKKIYLHLLLAMDNRENLEYFANTTNSYIREYVFKEICNIKTKRYDFKEWEIEFIISTIIIYPDSFVKKSFTYFYSHLCVRANALLKQKQSIEVHKQITFAIYVHANKLVLSNQSEDAKLGAFLYAHLYECIFLNQLVTNYPLHKTDQFDISESPLCKALMEYNLFTKEDDNCTFEKVFSGANYSVITINNGKYHEDVHLPDYVDALNGFYEFGNNMDIYMDEEIETYTKFMLGSYCNETFSRDLMEKCKTILAEKYSIENENNLAYVCLRGLATILKSNNHIFSYVDMQEFLCILRKSIINFINQSEAYFQENNNTSKKKAERVLAYAGECYLSLSQHAVVSDVDVTEVLMYTEYIICSNLRFAVAVTAKNLKLFVQNKVQQHCNPIRSFFLNKLSEFDITMQCSSRLRRSAEHRAIIMAIISGVAPILKQGNYVDIAMYKLMNVVKEHRDNTSIVISINVIIEIVQDSSLKKYTQNYMHNLLRLCMANIQTQSTELKIALYRLFNVVSSNIVGSDKKLLSMSISDLYNIFPDLKELHNNLRITQEDVDQEKVSQDQHSHTSSKMLLLILISKTNNSCDVNEINIKHHLDIIQTYLNIYGRYQEVQLQLVVKAITNILPAPKIAGIFFDLCPTLYNSNMPTTTFYNHLIFLESLKEKFEEYCIKAFIPGQRSVILKMQDSLKLLRDVYQFRVLQSNQLVFDFSRCDAEWVGNNIPYIVQYAHPLYCIEILKSTLSKEVNDVQKLSCIIILYERFSTNELYAVKFFEAASVVLLSIEYSPSIDAILSDIIYSITDYNLDFSESEINILRKLDEETIKMRAKCCYKYVILYAKSISCLQNFNPTIEVLKIILVAFLNTSDDTVFVAYKCLHKVTDDKIQLLKIFLYLLVMMPDSLRNGMVNSYNILQIPPSLSELEVIKMIITKRYLAEYFDCSQIIKFFHGVLWMLSKFEFASFTDKQKEKYCMLKTCVENILLGK